MRARNILSSNLRTGFRFTLFAELRLLHAHPDGALKGTIFAHKIARKRQSLFGQKCELDSAHKCAEHSPKKE